MPGCGLQGLVSEYQSKPEAAAGWQIKERTLNMPSTNPPAFSPTFTSAPGDFRGCVT